jgi:predicted NBD/HSP70 family sugar kinase
VPHFKWHQVALAKEMSAAIKLPVTADNDANAAALAELWFGRPEVQETRDFIMVLVDEGLGTGIVFDGQVYRGEFGSAGEFGHMTIGTGAPIACASGSHSCWESFASERAALARYSKLDGAENGHHEVSFKELVERALKHENNARAALRETAHYLGVGISNLIKGLSPQAVIVSGSIVRAWPLIFEDITKAVAENICLGLPPVRVIASTLGAQPTLMGALSLVLASKFASAHTS